MSFPWLDTTPPRGNGAEQRAKVAAAELSSRAALLFRLGFSEAAATQRLCERIAWEYDQPRTGSHQRHDSLSDAAIGKIVAETYARKPK